VILNDSKDCRHAYREILQGYSQVEEKDLYIKHFKETDLGELEYLYKVCEKDLRGRGIDSEKEKLEFLEEQEYWVETEEVQYIEAKLAVQDAYIFRDKLVDPAQRENFKQVIEDQEKNLKSIHDLRHELVEPTIEGFCDKKLSEHYVQKALFKDSDLKEPLLSPKEFENVSFIELSELVNIYNNCANKFSQKNVDRIGVNSFFLNPFMMSDNDPVKFYGTSVLDLTLYQLNLYSKGKYYKSVLEEGKDPPSHLYELIDKDGLDPIVSWFDTSYNQIRAERERSNAASARQRATGR
jgi:hypothetical protein